MKTEWDVPWAPTSRGKGRGELLLIAEMGHCSHAGLGQTIPQLCWGWPSNEERSLRHRLEAALGDREQAFALQM